MKFDNYWLLVCLCVCVCVTDSISAEKITELSFDNVVYIVIYDVSIDGQ